MRRSKEIVILLTLLVGAMVFVLWYVIDRRARNRAAPPAAARTLAPAAPAPATVPAPAVAVAAPSAPAPAPAAPAAESVNLAQHERQTVDYSSGKAVVKNSAEDQAAIDAAMKDIAEATKGVSFDAPPKKAAPAK